jgi:hypothetical protein
MVPVLPGTPLEGCIEFILSVDVPVSGLVPAAEPVLPGALLAELHGDAPGVEAVPVVLLVPFGDAVELKGGVLPPRGAVEFVFPMTEVLRGGSIAGALGAALPPDGAAVA